MIKTQEEFFNKIYVPLTLLQGFEKGYSKFACERELETEQNWNILTSTPMAVNVVSFSFSWCSTGGPGVHFAGCWLSLLHLISNFSGLQIPSGCGFPYHISSISPSPTVTATVTWLLSWLNYIIVQRPLIFGMTWLIIIQQKFTVMQFTGHSLPVHHSEWHFWPGRRSKYNILT